MPRVSRRKSPPARRRNSRTNRSTGHRNSPPAKRRNSRTNGRHTTSTYRGDGNKKVVWLSMNPKSGEVAPYRPPEASRIESAYQRWLDARWTENSLQTVVLNDYQVHLGVDEFRKLNAYQITKNPPFRSVLRLELDGTGKVKIHTKEIYDKEYGVLHRPSDEMYAMNTYEYIVPSYAIIDVQG